ncbi:MAG: ECF transporter S component [Eubacteriales bacterium]|nr:ECF transporter S component [Eubacteriales bacterium]MDD4716679.1 ECF transporter S component [Eubacteriales bacterium]NCU25121.1 ECF transporter S component [Candidatus Nomurabacteria bacterium]
MDKRKIRKIAYGGILTGLVLVATMFLQMPNGLGGYINLGDGVIFASAILLGPFAGLVGALGAATSDFLLAYGVYVPATFAIKGAMGLTAGIMLRSRKGDSYFFKALTFLICEVIMVGGYFAFETMLFGLSVSVPSIMPNIVQGVAGIAVGLALTPIMHKVIESEKFSV